MTPQETKGRLEHLLKERGFSLANPDPLLALEVFVAAAQEPVTGVQPNDEEVWVEIGTYSEGGRLAINPAFSLNFTRQFSFRSTDGEYEGMDQLYLSLFAQSSPETEAAKAHLFLRDFPSPADFIREVLSDAGGAVAMREKFTLVELDYTEV